MLDRVCYHCQACLTPHFRSAESACAGATCPYCRSADIVRVVHASKPVVSGGLPEAKAALARVDASRARLDALLQSMRAAA